MERSVIRGRNLIRARSRVMAVPSSGLVKQSSAMYWIDSLRSASVSDFHKRYMPVK